MTRAYLAWAAVCVIWGTTYLAIRIALETIPPFLMAALRWGAAGGVLVATLRFRGQRLPDPRAWPTLAVLGLLMLAVGNGAVVWAEQSVPSGLTAVLVSSAPFWIIGVERLMPNGAALTIRHVIGLAIGFCGIVVLVWPELRLDDSNRFLQGVLATQVACLGWAIGTAYSRRRGDDEHVLAGVSIQMLAAGACLLILALIGGEWRDVTFNQRTVGALIYLVLAGSIVGYSAYAYAIRHLPVATVSLYAYVNPVIAVLLGTIVLREPLSARLGVACAVVLAGTAIVKSTDR